MDPKKGLQRQLSKRRTKTCLTRFGRNHVPAHCLVEITSLPIEQFSVAVFTSLFQENLVPDKCSVYFRKRPLGHREAIRRKRPVMLSDGVILLHYNTPRLLAKLKNCCKSSSGKSGVTPIQTRFGTQSGFQTLIWNKVLFKQ
ncbi:hypothetical protein AVEN_28384-1 [Araneus ventricosus]|uniref:Uncharacterized protein n=1 Tax=Araneus ventricosus TaxID=182803 RepID=A0A4Y2JJC5_ARAVE|nr:hypothetical protein AVEN_28384-1 [Araneus ventricosus]